MTNEAKEKAAKALSKLCIGKLLGFEKQVEKVEPIEGFNTEFERQISQLIASIINKEHEYTEAFVKWVSNALLNYAKHEIDKQGEQKPTDEEMKEALRTEYEKGRADAIAEMQVAWSEEDENYLQSAENACEYQYGKNTSTILWLKSLKQKIGR